MKIYKAQETLGAEIMRNRVQEIDGASSRVIALCYRAIDAELIALLLNQREERKQEPAATGQLEHLNRIAAAFDRFTTAYESQSAHQASAIDAALHLFEKRIKS